MKARCWLLAVASCLIPVSAYAAEGDRFSEAHFRGGLCLDGACDRSKALVPVFLGTAYRLQFGSTRLLREARFSADATALLVHHEHLDDQWDFGVQLRSELDIAGLDFESWRLSYVPELILWGTQFPGADGGVIKIKNDDERFELLLGAGLGLRISFRGPFVGVGFQYVRVLSLDYEPIPLWVATAGWTCD